MAGASSIMSRSSISPAASPSSGFFGLGISWKSFSWQIRSFPLPRARSLSCTCQLSPLPQISKPLIADHDSRSRLNSMPLHHKVLPPQDDQIYNKRIEELEEITRKVLQKASKDNPTVTMKLIDNIQQLGISYHFEEEINALLERFSDYANEDLFTTALQFRLLRYNGYPTCCDIFDKFMNKNGKFKESLSKDTLGMLSLYEASYLGAKSEENLSEAMKFTKTHLIRSMTFLEPQLSRQVGRALELPRHLRMARLEARNYIDDYSRESDCNLALLELAKLDFDKVQSLHQSELKEVFRWWKQLGLVDKLSFARDRPPECFLWTLGIFPEPYQSSCRIELTKTIAILLVIDDIFDSFASLDELVLFTDAIRRWDLGAMEQLPEYMKICYMALYNTTNDIAYAVLKQHGWNIVPNLKRTWIDIIESFLVEARWFNKGYVPTLEEYLSKSVVSGGTLMALVHSFFLMGQGVTKETMTMMEPYPKLFSCSGQILRLWDDLGTAREEQERGDVAKSIECYMKQNDISIEDEAREHVRQLIRSLWVELNGELLVSRTLPISIIKTSFNLSRTAQIIYQHGDDNKAFGVGDIVQALLYRPIGFQVQAPNHCMIGQNHVQLL